MSYSEIILLISLSHMVMLFFGAIRRRKSNYVKWLAASWAWLVLLNSTFYYHFVPAPYLFLFSPLFLRALLFSFFEKPLPAPYLLQAVPPVLLAAVCFVLPLAGMWLSGFYLLFEAFSLSKAFIRFSRQRGISLPGGGSKKVSWMLFFFIANGLLLAAGLMYGATGHSAFQTGFVVVSFLISSQAAWFFSKEEAHEPLSFTQKYESSSLDQPEKYRILTALDHQLSAKKYALDANASLAGLAKKVFATPHQLSQVINESKGMGFHDLMAYHRVQEAKKLLRNPANRHLKIEEIGENVGYMSKSSFNTVFKKFTGKTPSDYREGGVRDHHVERREHGNVPAPIVEQGTFGPLQNISTMFNSFIKIYVRSLARNKAFSLINITGLVIGLASALMILVYLQNELSYDRFHDRAEDIYRIAFMSDNPQTRTPHPMAQEMVREFPEVESAVTLTPLYGPGLTKQSMYIRNPEKDVMFREPDGYAADSTFFKVFDFELLVGNEDEALREIGGLIISESLARKYFGDENPLGKILEIDSEGHPAMVTGIMKDVPQNSHFHPNFIISYVTLKYMDPNNFWFQWGDYGHFNYVKLKAGSNAAALEDKLPAWLYRLGHISDQWYGGFKSGELRFALQPITDIHLKSHIRWELEANGNIVYVYILIAAVVFILLITSINYINLSTARAFERAKEAGVRRTLGAGKTSISGQFLFETVLTCLVALLLAFAIVALSLSAFRDLTGRQIELSALLSPSLILVSLCAALLIGGVSGLIPALTIARIKPGEMLKGKFTTSPKTQWLRKSLVVVQFAVSSVMIFGSVILVSQVKYMEDLPLGYDDEKVVVIELKSDKVKGQLEVLKDEIKKIPGVAMAGAMSNMPGSQFNQNGIIAEEQPDKGVDVSQMQIDFDGHLPLGIELADGRWFDRSSALDSLGQAFILNERAVRELGLANPIGSRLYWDDDDDPKAGYIVGVVKDFHYQSMHVAVQPLLIQIGYGELGFLLVKINGENTSETMASLEKTYLSFDDKFGFEAYFLDQKNQDLYMAERQALQVFTLFAGIALFLAALGLLGLAYLTIIQRTKEIGIRKILGATINNILWKENLSFLKLLAVALAMGLPVAFLTMKEWLAGFAYQVPVGVYPFVVTVAIIVVIACLSVTLAILRTVLANPSEALRYE